MRVLPIGISASILCVLQQQDVEERAPAKLKLSLPITRHHGVEVYGGVGVLPHTFLNP